MVISDRKNKLIKPSHRFLLLMSIFDVMQSTAAAFSTMPMPKNPDYPGTVGNETTCTIQGFFMILGLAVPLYNSSLNLFFLLSIRYNIDPKIFSHKVEPYLHAFSILVPLTISITFAVTGKMKPRISVCYPKSNAGYILISALLILCIIFCLYSMSHICWTVISQNRSMDKYIFKRMNNENNSTRSNRGLMSNDRETVKQAVMYTCAFFLTYTFPIVGGMIYFMGYLIPFWSSILTNIFYPLQGFWNFFFYVRPGINYVLETTDKSFIGAVREVVFNGKALSMQRKNNPRSIARKTSLNMLSRRKNSTFHSFKPNTEIKLNSTEGVLDDEENSYYEPEERILHESLSDAVQNEQNRETKNLSQNASRKGEFELSNLQPRVNNGHLPNVGNDLMEDFGHKAESQSGRIQQRRRSSFTSLASVLCETDLV